MEWLLILAALAVGLWNGANDNFKGFATVWGSDTLPYRRALGLATVATATGSLLSLVLAKGLVQKFSGAGLVPDAMVGSPLFMTAVAGGAAATVWLATRLGFPISTTHALIGGLIGAALAQGGGVHLARLADTFLMPLLLSPVVAAVLGVAAYRVLRLRSAERHSAEKDCACVVSAPLPAVAEGAMASRSAIPNLVLAPAAECESLPVTAQLSVPRVMDRLHVASAMSICFARAVNDTPKMVALLLAARALNPRMALVAVAGAIAAGGVVFAKRVAQTMSHRITRMDHTQGLSANLITAGLVLFASRLGMPVSTTHVAVGAIAGVGAKARTLDRRAFFNIVLSWIVTLPVALGVAWTLVRMI